MIDIYDTNTAQLLKDTRHVDMSALRESFIAELPQAAADTVRILDAGNLRKLAKIFPAPQQTHKA